MAVPPYAKTWFPPSDFFALEFKIKKLDESFIRETGEGEGETLHRTTLSQLLIDVAMCPS